MRTLFFSLMLSATFWSCQNTPKKNSITTAPSEEVSNDWENLIVPGTFEGWHIFQNDGTKKGWTVEGDVFTFDSGKAEGNGDKSLLSDKQYTNFEIQFDWRVSPGANSGFMWGVQEDSNYSYPFQTGPEIQVLDPMVDKGNPDEIKHSAGSLYDIYAPTVDVTKPAGEWNTFHITINHNDNEAVVVQNGVEINRFELHGPKWETDVENSKFKGWEGFGKYPTGAICLQDHPGIISFKNIKIKELL